VRKRRIALVAIAIAPGARKVVLAGRGHSPLVEEPQRLARPIAEFARRRP
jgi:pimeloyl-ACP methyl ester carboxylesterase